MACTLFAAGYKVLRLKLRDHGASHHLNRAFFHAARINEVIGAIAAAPRFDTTELLSVIRFSLGGIRGPAQNVQPRLAAALRSRLRSR